MASMVKIEERDWVTPVEYAKIVGVTRTTVYEWMKDGRVYFEQPGGAHSLRMIPKSEIPAFIRKEKGV